MIDYQIHTKRHGNHGQLGLLREEVYVENIRIYKKPIGLHAIRHLLNTKKLSQKNNNLAWLNYLQYGLAHSSPQWNRAKIEMTYFHLKVKIKIENSRRM
jgi:hypothetical protein